MASSCQKPSSLVFDSDIAEQWRMFELDYAHYIRIIHRNDPDDLKTSLLLNLAGPEAVIRAANFEFIPALNDANGQVFVPAESIDNPMVLLRKFRELCDLPSKRILERTRFFARQQQVDKPVERFINDLRHMATRCHFGELTNALVRDKIVGGMSDRKLRAELLRNAELTLEQAIHSCRMAEVVAPLANFNLASPQQRHNVNLANYSRWNFSNVPRKSPNVPATRCPNCNFHSRGRQFCVAHGKVCHNCKKLNHFATCCRSRGNTTSRTNLHLLQQELSDSDSQEHDDASHGNNSDNTDNDSAMLSLLRSSGKLLDPAVTMVINNKALTAKVDTGAKVNVMSLRVQQDQEHGAHEKGFLDPTCLR